MWNQFESVHLWRQSMAKLMLFSIFNTREILLNLFYEERKQNLFTFSYLVFYLEKYISWILSFIP